jgi:hypothetical protein
LLGVTLPKGTNVLFMTNGPSFITPALPVDENLRSQSSKDAKEKNGQWDPEGCSEFRPERWMKVNGEGKDDFNSLAGPNAQFGGGVRGCFGMLRTYYNTPPSHRLMCLSPNNLSQLQTITNSVLSHRKKVRIPRNAHCHYHCLLEL